MVSDVLPSVAIVLTMSDKWGIVFQRDIFQLSVHYQFWETIANGNLYLCFLHRSSKKELTHWTWVTHIWVSKLTIIAWDDGLLPGQRQAFTWSNVGILLIGPLGTNFSEILIKIYTLSFKEMHFKMSSGKWRPFCLCVSVLRYMICQGNVLYIAPYIDYCPSCIWRYLYTDDNHYISAERGREVSRLSGALSVSIRVSMCVSVCQPWVYPSHNSSPVQTRITKFGPKVQNC